MGGAVCCDDRLVGRPGEHGEQLPVGQPIPFACDRTNYDREAVNVAHIIIGKSQRAAGGERSILGQGLGVRIAGSDADDRIVVGPGDRHDDLVGRGQRRRAVVRNGIVEYIVHDFLNSELLRIEGRIIQRITVAAIGLQIQRAVDAIDDGLIAGAAGEGQAALGGALGTGFGDTKSLTFHVGP